MCCIALNYNFKRFLACMIFLTTRSVLVFLPGNRSMAWIILVLAFHLTCKFLARLVVLFSNLVQAIDAGIPTFQTFGQMRARAHVLIPRPMKFFAGFSNPFLYIQCPSSLGAFPFDTPSPLGGHLLVTVVIQSTS